MTIPYVLSHFQAAPLLKSRQAGQAKAMSSLDLSQTEIEVNLTQAGVDFSEGLSTGEQVFLSWGTFKEIDNNPIVCYQVVEGTARPIRSFSEMTGRAYSLMPTHSAPTMLVSGIPMHRIKDTDPHLDTMEKIHALGKIGGRLLDTATGLGYTAIEAARTAAQVVTIELDPAAQGIARLNPWSRALFGNPRITQVIGDSNTEIEHFEDHSFSVILHDPPMFALAGDLYSLAFYRQAFRVLKPGGRMFHYIGDPESKSGASTTRGVTRRLIEAGFRRIEPRPRAFGVLALK